MMGIIKFKPIEETPNDKASMYQRYEDYLSKHIKGVQEVYETILKPQLIKDGVSQGTITLAELHINEHDKSKYSYEEYNAYADRFYGLHDENYDHTGFDVAWNHHQKCNPHHWQYWCLIQDVDEPQIKAMDMPLDYIIEMLSDWQSAGQHYGNTAYDWYMKQKDKMILSDKTREIVEKYIPLFKK